VKENAVKLFFQYKKGTIHSYSDISLTNAVYYLPELHHYLENKTKNMIMLLEDLPMHIFALYTHYLFSFEPFQYIEDIPTIRDKVSALKNDELTNKLIIEMKTSTYSGPVQMLGANTFLVSIPKLNMKHNYTYDYLVHVTHKEVKKIELLTDFTMEFHKKDSVYEKNKRLFVAGLEEFEQKNKLRLFFVS